jgi:hypothetical protein
VPTAVEASGADNAAACDAIAACYTDANAAATAPVLDSVAAPRPATAVPTAAETSTADCDTAQVRSPTTHIPTTATVAATTASDLDFC